MNERLRPIRPHVLDHARGTDRTPNPPLRQLPTHILRHRLKQSLEILPEIEFPFLCRKQKFNRVHNRHYRTFGSFACRTEIIRQFIPHQKLDRDRSLGRLEDPFLKIVHMV